jgi:hypothetical protein
MNGKKAIDLALAVLVLNGPLDTACIVRFEVLRGELRRAVLGRGSPTDGASGLQRYHVGHQRAVYICKAHGAFSAEWPIGCEEDCGAAAPSG